MVCSCVVFVVCGVFVAVVLCRCGFVVCLFCVWWLCCVVLVCGVVLYVV